MESDITLWAFLVGPLPSLLTGLLSRTSLAPNWKAIINLFISAVAGALVSLAANTGPVEATQIVTGAVITWVTSIATYYGFWKPTQVAKSVNETGGIIG